MSLTDPTSAELLTQANVAYLGLLQAIAARRATTYRVNGIEYRAEGESLRALKEFRDALMEEVALASTDRPRVMLGDISGRAC